MSGTQIKFQKLWKTYESICKSIKYFRYRVCPFYQFLMLGWVVLTGIWSLKPQEYDGHSVMAWNVLQGWFQFWSFWMIFKFCVWCMSAAFSPFSLGFWSWICIEQFRSRKLDKIHCIDDFTYLISSYLFQIFSMCILCSISSNHTKTCLFKMCTKYWPWNVHKKIFLGQTYIFHVLK